MLDVLEVPRVTPKPTSATFGVSPLVKLLGVVAVAQVVTTGMLVSLGFAPAVPWDFVPFLALVAFPLGYALFVGLHWLRDHVHPASPLIPTLLPVVGIAVIWWLFHYLTMWVSLPLLAFSLVHLLWRQRSSLLTLGGAIVIVFCGCAAVWNFNYLIAYVAGDRLFDAALMDWDLWCYGRLFGSEVAYEAIFPICRNPLAYALLERSYHFYFVEFFAVLFVFASRGKEVVRFLACLFFLYLVGLAIFALVPTIGPFTYYPACIDPHYHSSATWHVMRQITHEYQAVRAHEPLNGFGYFIALPSMHVAKALLIQLWLRGSPVLFWFFLPANVLMSLSTFLLGYHYVADFPAGVALTLAVFALWQRWWPVTSASAKPPSELQLQGLPS